MYFLALDQALANTGWSIIKVNTNPILINYGVIKTDSSYDLTTRLLSLETKINHIISIYNPYYIFLEQVHCPRNSPFAWPNLLVVENVLKLSFLKQQFKYLSLSAKLNSKDSWRYILNIKTSDKKHTKTLFNKLKINEHIADSIAIYLAGIITLKILKDNSLESINSYINKINIETKKVII